MSAKSYHRRFTRDSFYNRLKGELDHFTRRIRNKIQEDSDVEIVKVPISSLLDRGNLPRSSLYHFNSHRQIAREYDSVDYDGNGHFLVELEKFLERRNSERKKEIRDSTVSLEMLG